MNINSQVIINTIIKFERILEKMSTELSILEQNYYKLASKLGLDSGSLPITPNTIDYLSQLTPMSGTYKVSNVVLNNNKIENAFDNSRYLSFAFNGTTYVLVAASYNSSLKDSDTSLSFYIKDNTYNISSISDGGLIIKSNTSTFAPSIYPGYGGVCYGGGLFVACASSKLDNVTRIAYSRDGIMWEYVDNEVSGIPGNVSYTSIAYGNGTFVIFPANLNFVSSAYGYIMYTKDPLGKWYSTSYPIESPIPTDPNNQLDLPAFNINCCVYSDKFVAITANGDSNNIPKIITSTDGIVWTANNSIDDGSSTYASYFGTNIIYNPISKKYLIVLLDNSGDFIYFVRFATSSDLANWNIVTPPGTFAPDSFDGSPSPYFGKFTCCNLAINGSGFYVFISTITTSLECLLNESGNITSTKVEPYTDFVNGLMPHTSGCLMNIPNGYMFQYSDYNTLNGDTGILMITGS